MITTLDLKFQNEEKAIASFLVESNEGLILVESGPESTFDSLKEGVKNAGADIKDIRHVLLTHIHFDHAGAAWRLAEKGATVYVNPRGLKHLGNPERLWNSAERIYGDQMNVLWGEMKPIPDDLLKPLDEGDILRIGNLEINTIYTPGHAVHHNAYQIGDYIFTGDVAGIRIDKGPVMPPCPPPDIHIELWKDSIEKLKKLKPKGLYLTHFGLQTDVNDLFQDLTLMLDNWAQEVYKYYINKIPSEEAEPEFTNYVKHLLLDKGLSAEQIFIYEYANPSWMSVNGLLRYWRLKEEGRI